MTALFSSSYGERRSVISVVVDSPRPSHQARGHGSYRRQCAGTRMPLRLTG